MTHGSLLLYRFVNFQGRFLMAVVDCHGGSRHLVMPSKKVKRPFCLVMDANASYTAASVINLDTLQWFFMQTACISYSIFWLYIAVSNCFEELPVLRGHYNNMARAPWRISIWHVQVTVSGVYYIQQNWDWFHGDPLSLCGLPHKYGPNGNN